MSSLAAVACSLAVGILIASCGDDGGGNGGARSCGDATCSGDDCETPLRCPVDCGGCQGAQCTTTGSRGTCGTACASSCQCINQGEVCTADYGEHAGRCVPTDCLVCANFERCGFSPDTNGLCASVTCN